MKKVLRESKIWHGKTKSATVPTGPYLNKELCYLKIGICLLLRTLQSNIYIFYGLRFFNRPIFSINFFHRIVIRAPKIVREDAVVPFVTNSHQSLWMKSAIWVFFSVSAVRASLFICILLFKASISALWALFSLSSPSQSLAISERCAYRKEFCQSRNGKSSSFVLPPGIWFVFASTSFRGQLMS